MRIQKKATVNPVFEILPEIHEPALTRLYCEVSDQSFCYFFKNNTNNLVTGLSVFHFDNIKNGRSPAAIIKKILDGQDLLFNNHDVIISYAYPQCMLIPAAHYEAGKNEENLCIFFGDLEPGIILSDVVDEKNIVSVYRIPGDVEAVLKAHFPAAQSSHQFSSLAKQIGDDVNVLRVIFYQKKIVVSLVANGIMQIIQSYLYKTPEDVVYHLLSLCVNFEVNDPTLQLYGMIEKDSALFREIHKYFRNVEFSTLPQNCDYADGIKEFPAHYFSHLFELAPCV
ncbi:MAG: DUF3822 family protein [Ginsengibacter sp.]